MRQPHLLDPKPRQLLEICSPLLLSSSPVLASQNQNYLASTYLAVSLVGPEYSPTSSHKCSTSSSGQSKSLHSRGLFTAGLLGCQFNIWWATGTSVISHLTSAHLFSSQDPKQSSMEYVSSQLLRLGSDP